MVKVSFDSDHQSDRASSDSNQNQNQKDKSILLEIFTANIFTAKIFLFAALHITLRLTLLSCAPQGNRVVRSHSLPHCSRGLVGGVTYCLQLDLLKIILSKQVINCFNCSSDSNERSMHGENLLSCIRKISDRGKYRLRLAARFLRQNGHQFKKGEFYMEVLARITELDPTTREYLKGIVDWVEEYETEEQKLFGTPSRSRTPKSKSRFSSNRALHASPTQQQKSGN